MSTVWVRWTIEMTAINCIFTETAVHSQTAGKRSLYKAASSPFLHSSCGVGTVLSYVRTFVRSYVRTYILPSRNVRLCTTNKRLDQEALFFAHICILRRNHSLPIFIQIANVLDLHFQGQRIESSTLGSSNVIISQTVTVRSNIAIANT